MAAQPMQPSQQALRVQRRLSRERRLSLVVTACTALLAVIFLWPFMAVLAQSFNRLDVVKNPMSIIPTAFTFELYEMIVTRYHLERYFLNTLGVVTTTTVLSTFASALAGYALAKLPFRGRNIALLLILAVMLLPTDSMLVSKFVVMRQLGLLNSYWGLVLPSIGGGAFGIFLMRQFMLQIPTEMLESGRIDGCNEFGLFLRLVLPNMKASVAVLAILSLSGSWNSVLWPQILISDENMQLIMPAIMRLRNGMSTDAYATPVTIAAAIVCALLPLGLYLYSQRFFTAALAGALKG
ncbi:carbohydrate ABC transporter permease [Chloroflexia bacterium SDU3-3]|nr:carbohydrate ABC transporter permease [Chloroflexia bacterium SDU3-3]